MQGRSVVIIAAPIVLAAEDVGLGHVPSVGVEGARGDGAVAGHKEYGGVVQLQGDSGAKCTGYEAAGLSLR